MIYTTSDIPRLLFLLFNDTPMPPEETVGGSATKDPRRSTDWVAELVDIRRAWPKIQFCRQGRILAAIFRDNLPLSAIESPDERIEPEYWVGAAAQALADILNKEAR